MHTPDNPLLVARKAINPPRPRFVVDEPYGELQKGLRVAGRLAGAGLYDLALDLVKAATHKYLRRIPTGKARPRWRYIYNETSKHHDAKVSLGEKVLVTSGGRKGHYEVIDFHGSWVTLRHDESGEHVSVKKEYLHELFKKEHGKGIGAAHERLTRIYEAAKKHGSDKQRSNAWKELAEFERRMGVGRFAKKPEKGEKLPAPKLTILEPETVASEAVAARTAELQKLDTDVLDRSLAEVNRRYKQLSDAGEAIPIHFIRWQRILAGAIQNKKLERQLENFPQPGETGEQRKERIRKRKRKPLKLVERTRFGNKDAAWKAIKVASGDLSGFGDFQIGIMFAMAPLVILKSLPRDRSLRILGVPNRILIPVGWALLCVGVETVLNHAGLLVWDYWWWRCPHIYLIVIAYSLPFVLIAVIYDRMGLPAKRRAAAIVVITTAALWGLFAGILGWI